MPRFTNPAPEFDFQGSSIAYGELYFYESGTNTQKITYADAQETIPNTQPVKLDADGRAPNIFYSGVAKVVLRTSPDAEVNPGQQVFERDPVGADVGIEQNFNSWIPDASYSYNAIVQGSNQKFYISTANNNIGNDPLISSGQWALIQFIQEWTVNQTFDNGEFSQFNGIQWTSQIDDNKGNTPGEDSTKWKPTYEIKKSRNAITDPMFDFWYEGTSQTSSGYGSDTMWLNGNTGSTKTHTRENLVAGVDLPSFDNPTAKYFSRTVVSSVAGAGNFVYKQHRIENVATFAGKTVTLSFYAKADSPKDISFDLSQNFGSGGSASVSGIGAQKISLTTSWARYEATIPVPSVSGKTIGTADKLAVFFWFDAGSNFDARTDSLGQQSGTFDLACIQLEEGTQATKFEELSPEEAQSAVNRYFYQGKFEGQGAPRLYAAAGSIGMFAASKNASMRDTPIASIVSTGTLTNCTNANVVANADGAALRVDVTATGVYRVLDTVFSLDARL